MNFSINTLLADPELIEKTPCSLFYDWFCNKHTLPRRAKAMIPKIKFLVDQGIINGETTYVWFKNNCPVSGSTYDDMRFSSLISDDVYVGGVAPRLGYDRCENRAMMWYFEGKEREIVQCEFKNWRELKRAIKNNTDQLRDKLTDHMYIK